MGGRAARRGVGVGNVPARAGVRGGCTRVSLWFEERGGGRGTKGSKKSSGKIEQRYPCPRLIIVA